TKARSGEQSSNSFERARHQSDLLLALAGDSFCRGLSGIDASCRQLPQFAIDACPILTNQNDAAIVCHWDEHYGGTVSDHRDFVFLSVGQAPSIYFDREPAAFETKRH